MKIESLNDVLNITGIVELTAGNATQVKEEVRSALRANHKIIDIDLSRTTFMDSSGLGVLISLHKTMCAQQGQVRISNPTDTANQVLELTRLHRLFEIVRS